VIVLGNVRSGTTMLQNMIGLDPDSVTWFEPRTIWAYAAPMRRHDLFDTSDATPRVKRYIRGRFLKFQEAHGNKRIIEKTPSNLMRIPYVNEIFPEALYVYILRNPLSYIFSSEILWKQSINKGKFIKRLNETPTIQLPCYLPRLAADLFSKRILKRRYVSVWGVRYPGIQADLKSLSTFEVIAKQWTAASHQAEADLHLLGDRMLQLRYEDLVTNPAIEFEKIYNHLGMDYSANIKKQIQNIVQSNRQNKWQKLDSAIVSKCIPQMADEMVRQGYNSFSEVSPELNDVIEEHAELLRSNG
jgi:hypothetical protein